VTYTNQLNHWHYRVKAPQGWNSHWPQC